jgi:hypothetical protein
VQQAGSFGGSQQHSFAMDLCYWSDQMLQQAACQGQILRSTRSTPAAVGGSRHAAPAAAAKACSFAPPTLLVPCCAVPCCAVLCCYRELLAAGFKVRAAARDVDQAKANTDIAVQFGLIAPDQLSRLTWVEMDLDEPDSIRPAIGGATKVCVCGKGLWESGGGDGMVMGGGMWSLCASW